MENKIKNPNLFFKKPTKLILLGKKNSELGAEP
jgi:hypothetical protein